MPNKSQSAAAKADTPAAVKAAAVKPPRAPRVHAAKAGTVEGPKGKNMPDATNTPEVPEEQRQGERRQAQDTAMAQFAQSQMTTPASHEAPQATEDELKAKAFAEAVQAMAASMGVNAAEVLNLPVAGAAKQAKAPRADKQVQNNVTRPASNTKTGQIWDLADKISHDQQGHPALISQLRACAELKQCNEHTLKTQYARWRSYHGIKGRAVLVPKKAEEGRDEGIEQAFSRRASDKVDEPQPAAE